MAARPRVVAALAAHFGDIDLAEDGFAAAVEAALHEEGIHDPAAFLFVTGKRKILDMQRSARRAAARDAAFAGEATSHSADDEPFETVPDERLRLLFICCHPAISLEARAMLALRIVLGVDVELIASGFLLKPDAARQRITRAKRKIREARLRVEMPPREEWDERVAAVLLALELAYTAAYRDSEHLELAVEVERLALLLVELLPGEGEILGLAALVMLARSRESARGVPLSEQDPRRWDRERILAAQRLLDRHFTGGIGRCRLLALVHLTHARRYFGAETDWAAIVVLYDCLAQLDPGPVVAINRALAMGRAGDAAGGLAALPAEMPGFAPWYAAHGDLLAMAGQPGAAEALRRALALTQATDARSLLQRRLATCST